MDVNERNYIFQTNLQSLAMREKSDSVENSTNGAAATHYSEENLMLFTRKTWKKKAWKSKT